MVVFVKWKQDGLGGNWLFCTTRPWYQ